MVSIVPIASIVLILTITPLLQTTRTEIFVNLLMGGGTNWNSLCALQGRNFGEISQQGNCVKWNKSIPTWILSSVQTHLCCLVNLPETDYNISDLRSLPFDSFNSEIEQLDISIILI